MDSENPNSSEIVNNVRTLSISRHGGIRTRGGRLPPIRMRDIAQVTGTKKFVAPKIPQRRVVKKEVTDPTERMPLIKTELKEDSRELRDRGKGRASKVIVQMEGTFLAQGPAARIKREPSDYETFSMPKYSASAAASREKYDIKRSQNAMKDILKSDSSDEEDNSIPMSMRCFPALVQKIKEENFVPEISKIKQEPLDEDDIKSVIKTEPEDTWNALEGKFFNKVEVDMKPETKKTVDELCDVEGKGKLILLQMPSCLPFNTEQHEDSSKDGEEKPKPSFFESLPEGHIGKLQVFKSGKKRLMIGSVAFELVDGIESDTMKQLVTIRLHDDGGDLTVLGNVEKTMVMKPDIEELLKAVALDREQHKSCSD